MDIVQLLLTGIVSAACSLAVIYFRSYTGEKGKSRATKEDIEEITDLVKAVEGKHAEQLARITEELKAQSTLRGSVVERRMDAHQKAYALAGKMLQILYGLPDRRMELQRELAEFWAHNCLYLDERAREAFDKAWVAFLRHPSLIELQPRQPYAVIETNFRDITALGPSIVAAASLPSLRLDSTPADPDRIEVKATPDAA